MAMTHRMGATTASRLFWIVRGGGNFRNLIQRKWDQIFTEKFNMTVPNKVEVKSMIVYLEIFYEGPLIYITGEQPFQDSSIRRFAIGLFLSVISGYVKSSR